jgi:hypothetical protein
MGDLEAISKETREEFLKMSRCDRGARKRSRELNRATKTAD